MPLHDDMSSHDDLSSHDDMSSHGRMSCRDDDSSYTPRHCPHVKPPEVSRHPGVFLCPSCVLGKCEIIAGRADPDTLVFFTSGERRRWPESLVFCLRVLSSMP